MEIKKTDCLLNFAELYKVLPVPKRTINNWMHDPKMRFPAPFYIGQKCFWKQSSVLQWINVNSRKDCFSPLQPVAPIVDKVLVDLAEKVDKAASEINEDYVNHHFPSAAEKTEAIAQTAIELKLEYLDGPLDPDKDPKGDLWNKIRENTSNGNENYDA